MKHLVRNGILIISILILAINIIYMIKISREQKDVTRVNQAMQQMEENNRKNSNGEDKESDTGMKIMLADGFFYEPISETIKARITGMSYKENDKIDYSDLRYVTVKYVDFDGNTQTGELIVNVQIADDILEIFKELYDAGYEIEKMRLVDDYQADDNASMADNNTSAFNFRVVDGTDVISDHSYGVAIDINPLYNPYVRIGYGEKNILPENGVMYADRSLDFPHKIVKDDICYQTFIRHGFLWGGDWNGTLDYQHFYKEIAHE